MDLKGWPSPRRRLRLRSQARDAAACGLDVVRLDNHMKSLRRIAKSKRPSLALVIKDLQAKPAAQIKALSAPVDPVPALDERKSKLGPVEVDCLIETIDTSVT